MWRVSECWLWLRMRLSISLRWIQKKLVISRYSAPLAENLEAVDIADAAPDVDPAGAVRFSIYNDPSGFMELEAVGGCVKEKLTPGTVLGVHITNVFKKLED